MSLEEAIAANTAALIENSAAHKMLADVATAAATGKSVSKPEPEKEKAGSEEETRELTAAEKKAANAAKRRKAAAAKKAAEKAEPPELTLMVTAPELRKLAAAFMDGDDDEARELNKTNFIGGLQHVGAAKLTELEDDAERARVAGYLAYWSAGLEVNFEAIDEILDAMGSGEDDGGDDPMG